ncbi:MAG: flagellar hook-length control protein FliK [Proteobacteria bacterium]|nr:flagellar hook-length control protein FliK [Pseudomonadota bacterium]MBU1456584.1 flagellar hook-length control protein FliK [Pseudomonadota bacterium]
MNTIKPLSPVKPVGSSTSDSDARQQSQHQTRSGQIFTATVLESAGSNRVFLIINGQKILAQSDTDVLSAGIKLKLQVLTTTPLVELKIISDAPQSTFGRTVTLLGKNLDITGFSQSLPPPSSALLHTGSTSSQKGQQSIDSLQKYPLGISDSGTVLKQLIDRLGLSLDALLAKDDSTSGVETLNAALLKIAVLLKNAETVAETTNRLFETLELHQFPRLKLNSEHLFLYSLPLPFLDHGYLLIDKDQSGYKSEGEDNLFRFSLHLSLAPLGDIEIHFSPSKNGLSIHFACESEEKKEFTRAYQNDLKNNLSSTDLLELSFSATARDPASVLIQQLAPEGESMLDTKV